MTECGCIDSGVVVVVVVVVVSSLLFSIVYLLIKHRVISKLVKRNWLVSDQFMHHHSLPHTLLARPRNTPSSSSPPPQSRVIPFPFFVVVKADPMKTGFWYYMTRVSLIYIFLCLSCLSSEDLSACLDSSILISFGLCDTFVYSYVSIFCSILCFVVIVLFLFLSVSFCPFLKLLIKGSFCILIRQIVLKSIEAKGWKTVLISTIGIFITLSCYFHSKAFKYWYSLKNRGATSCLCMNLWSILLAELWFNLFNTFSYLIFLLFLPLSGPSIS